MLIKPIINKLQRKSLRCMLLVLIAGGMSSCAIQTFDEKTGTAHLWGWGHLSLRVQGAEDDATLQAVTVGTQTLGANLDTTAFSSGAGVGYHSSRVTYVVSPNTQLRLEEPHTSKFRLGRSFSTSTKTPKP
jgi:hypothetical protein